MKLSFAELDNATARSGRIVERRLYFGSLVACTWFDDSQRRTSRVWKVFIGGMITTVAEVRKSVTTTVRDCLPIDVSSDCQVAKDEQLIWQPFLFAVNLVLSTSQSVQIISNINRDIKPSFMGKYNWNKCKILYLSLEV